MSKGYVIKVGHSEPTEVIISQPNANYEPGPDAKRILHIPGKFLVVNMARVWARRVQNDGTLPKDASGNERPIEYTETNIYKGKLEFLKWGDNRVGAQQISIRFLRQSQSLDVEYQDNIQKVKIDPEGRDGSGFLELDAGENKFDEERDPLFVQMIKVHPQNKNSLSKNDNPLIQGYTYYEVTDEQVDKTEIKHFEATAESGVFITNISNDEQSLKNLFDLLVSRNINFGIVNKLSNGLDIYKALLKFGNNYPEDFNRYINEHKKMISDCFVKADSYKALDLTKNGFVAMIIDNKSEIIYEGAEGKGKQMEDWVLQNFLSESVYERTKRFKELCDTKLK